MSAVAATLHATLRLRGTLLFWGFYGFLWALMVPILLFSTEARTTHVPVMIIGFASWMGWMLFLSRLWQLQRHAEALCLPGARRNVERAALLLVAIGSGLPTLLLGLLGASPGWTLLAQWLALSSVLLYLTLPPATSGVLLVAASLSPMMGKWMGPLQPDADSLFLLLWGLVGVMLAVGLPRWRSLLAHASSQGWNAPQVIMMAERNLAGSGEQRDDPSLQWVGRSEAHIGEMAGPRTPLRALAVFLCGSLAPLGWRNYLRSSGWMLLVIGLFFLLMHDSGEESKRSGPSGALIAMLAVWALITPMTVITRLRHLWHSDGHGLAEAALLPGLARGGGSWWTLGGMIGFTTTYQLALPAALIAALLVIETGNPVSMGVPLLICFWSVAMVCALLPLARRRGGLAAFLLYAGIALVVVAVLAAHWLAVDHGMQVLWMVLLPCTLPVSVLAVLGWTFPKPGQPLVQP